MIASHRWFSTAIIILLALGIGLNTMVFTLVNAVLFKPLSLPGGKRLVAINSQQRSDPQHLYGVSYPDFRDFRASAGTFEAIEASIMEQGVVSERDRPAQAYNLGLITPGLFQMLQTPPFLGRPFASADGGAGGEAVLLLGYGVWKDRYASSRGVIGRVVRVNEKPATIIGVMPPGFKFPKTRTFGCRWFSRRRSRTAPTARFNCSLISSPASAFPRALRFFERSPTVSPLSTRM